MGEVIDFINTGKIIIVLYKSFNDAEICREFLINEINYKEILKNNCLVSWFDFEKDMNNIPLEKQNKFEKIHKKNEANIRDNNKK